MKVLRQIFWLTALFGFSAVNAEVSDKCPAFVSRWIEDEGAWNFLSTNESIIRLIIFSSVYIAIAVGLFFLVRRSKRSWIKLVPLVVAVLIGTFLVFDFLPKPIQDDPCSNYFLLQEMPGELYRIQIAFDFILFLVPLVLFGVLWKKSKK